MVEKKKKAQVFAVPGDETASGKHQVIYAPDGDLNAAASRGNIKSFSKWSDAEGFAHKKGKELGAEVFVHSYLKNPSYTTDYKLLPKQKSPLPKSKSLRITPKRPKLRR